MLNVSGINFKWICSVDEFQSRTEKLKEEALHIYDIVANEKSITFSKIAQKLADFELKFVTESQLLKFYKTVHTEKAFRDASNEVDKALSDFKIDLSMRKDIFDQFVKLKEELKDTLSGEALRYVDKKIKDGRHIGLHCSEEVRMEVQGISKELSNLKIEFEKNLCEENLILEFTEEGLKGCPESFIEALDKSESSTTMRKVSLKYPHYFPIMKYAINPETRKKIEFSFNTRCKNENAPLLKKMLILRTKRAKLLGYDTHADYILSMRMAKDAKTVRHFLQELRKKLQSSRDAELKMFLEYKKKLCEEHKLEFNGQIDAWDLRLLMNKYEEDKFSVDQEKVREYFPLTKVVEGMFDIYEKLLGLKFEAIDIKTWHPDAKMYSVKDSGDFSLLGYFFMDLHPREGKYGHAHVDLIQLGGINKAGKGEPERQVTVVVLLANFTKPTETRPALLNHDEVKTLFHEFGHVMHGLCSQTDFGDLIGFNIECDFLECPSQMLENWCWEAESLKLMSSHYQTGEPLEGELMKNLLRSRVANVGVFNMRQICLATFDQMIHTSSDSDCDPAEVYAKLSETYMSIQVSVGSHMPATFGHIAGGYDAQYYGYLWSEVFAADMFMSRFKVEGLLNVSAGKSYRNLILKPGCIKDTDEMIKDFLGRDPNQEAFLHLMGLN